MRIIRNCKGQVSPGAKSDEMFSTANSSPKMLAANQSKEIFKKGLSSLSDTMAGNDFLCTTMTSYDRCLDTITNPEMET